MNRVRALGFIIVFLFVPMFAYGQPAAPTETTVPDQAERIERLETAVKELQAKSQTPPPNTGALNFKPAEPHQTFTGLGPAASKIYFQQSPAVWGMSSEFFSFNSRHGRDSAGNINTNRTNVTSLAPTLAARLHPRVLFNSQILLENGGAESSNTVTLQKGQAVVLMAYADWFANEQREMGIRVGHQLIPFGWVNTLNEPVMYHGVLKPELERELIPSSWHENGVSAWVRRGVGEIQIGVFNSLDASGFRGDTFLAGGRSQGQSAKSADLMSVARVHANLEHVTVGASVAGGQTAQRGESYLHGNFNLLEFHTRLHFGPVELFGQSAQGRLQDTDSISTVNGTSIGSKARGYSIQLAVSPFRPWLWLFARHSHYDLHDNILPTLTRDNSLNKTADTFGVSYFPLPQWVIKAEYVSKKSAARNDDDEANFGTAVSF